MRRARVFVSFAAAMAVILLSGSTVSAADSGAAAAEPESAGLAVIDWGIIVIYGLSTLALGWFYGRNQKDTTEYFIGSGNMNPVLIGVSLFATLLSTISYLSMPGEMLGKGPVSLLSIIALPLVFILIAFWILPVYMKQHVTSAYELLEERLGVSVRLLGAGMFIVLRLVWMSLLVFFDGQSARIDDWRRRRQDSADRIDYRHGSRRLYLAGRIAGGRHYRFDADDLAVWRGAAGAGHCDVSVGWVQLVPHEWQANWDTQPLLPINETTGQLDVKMRVTVLGSIINVLIWYVATAAGDQTSVQRFMATTDAKAARRALATQLSVSVVVSITLGLVGLALLGYFSQHPELLPAGKNLKEHADEMFPLFIAYQLPVGISGIGRECDVCGGDVEYRFWGELDNGCSDERLSRSFRPHAGNRKRAYAGG